MDWSLKDSLCIFDIHYIVPWRKPARLSERVKLDFALPEELKSGLLEFFQKDSESMFWSMFEKWWKFLTANRTKLK